MEHHHHSLPAPPNYGACHIGDHESEYSRSIRTDSPVLGLLWLMFAMCLTPAALLKDATIGCLAFAYSMVVSSALLSLQWERSRAWKVYSVACFASAVVGLSMGTRIQQLYPMFDNRTVNFVAVKICFGVLSSLVVCMLLLGRALHWCDCGLIGSSEAFAEKHGWGWEPKAVPHMHFGFMWHSSAETDRDGNFPERVQRDLVNHRSYWSGEPALDYIFYMVNEHLYLSCLFSHPGHPFSKFERIMVMFLTALLVVFPVAAFDALFGPGLLKRVCTTLVVTAPRNFIKMWLRNIVVADSEIKHKAHDRHYDCKFQRLVHKHRDEWSEKSARLLELQEVITHVRSENAAWREVIFFSCLTAGIGCICYGCYAFIGKCTDSPWLTLQVNCDGILYGFVLELVIEMMFTVRKSSGRHKGGTFGGFFHRWWHEREEFGSLYRPSIDAA